MLERVIVWEVVWLGVAVMLGVLVCVRLCDWLRVTVWLAVPDPEGDTVWLELCV